MNIFYILFPKKPGLIAGLIFYFLVLKYLIISGKYDIIYVLSLTNFSY
nr:MAG TPA: hypothetical protein [Caudoviricetes sp.]